MADYENETGKEVPKSKKDEDAIAEARTRYEKAVEFWSLDREAALDDIKFRAGDQWPEEIAAQRERDKRPCLTVDKLAQYVRQIVNDGRQNRPSIKVRPVDSGADMATAEIFQGIIKHIEDQSGADAAYDTALDSAATCGQGYFRVLTRYTGDDTFNQDIVIERIRNPLSVVIDPMSKEADGSDMKFAFIVDEMSRDEYEETFPDKVLDDWEADYAKFGDWFGDIVRVAEYWWVEEEDRNLHLLDDGSIIDDEKKKAAEQAGLPLVIVESRKIPKKTVKHCLMSGSDYLEEPKVWPGKWIPLMVVWGNEIDVEGEVIHSGIIRPAKDAQRLYNYSRSAFAERVALTPKAPWVAAEGQIEDYADEWATANVENHSVLRYRPVSLNGQPVSPPIRQTAADIPAGFAQDMQISEHDIQGAIGMYAASLGAPSNERSGKAIMARQKEGDVGTFHYHDNLNRAIRHCGRILVDLIPKIYDSSRVVRILGYDGTPSEAEINPMIPTASQKIGMRMMYNLGVGKYDVSISTGPSYNTLRQEASSAMMEMVQANPALMQVIGDVMVKNMDWPGAEEMSERLKLTLLPEIQQAEQAKKQEALPPEMQQIMAQFEQAIQRKDELLSKATDKIEDLLGEVQAAKNESESKMIAADAKQKEVAIKEKELMLKAIETEIKAYDSETKRLDLIINDESVGGELPSIDLQDGVENPGSSIAPIMQSLNRLTKTIAFMGPHQPTSKPVIKRARAVKQPDGSWEMETIELPQDYNEGAM